MKKEIFFLVLIALIGTGCETTQPRRGYEAEVITEYVAGKDKEESPVTEEPAKEPPFAKKPENTQPAAVEKPEISEEEIAIAKEVEQLRENALEKYRKNRDSESAIKDLELALSNKPGKEQEAQVRRDLSTLYTLHALRFAHQKKFEESLPLFEKAAEADPSNAFVFMEKGATLRKMGKEAEAVAAFDKAIELNPEYHQALNARGLIRLNQGKYEEAGKDFDAALKLKPKFSWAVINRGLVYEKTGKLCKALECYEKAVKLAPDNGLAYNNRGWAYFQQKKYSLAIRDLTKAMELSPDLDLVYLNRASAFVMAGLTDRAVEDYEAFLDMFPKHSKAPEIKEWLENNRPHEHAPAEEHKEKPEAPAKMPPDENTENPGK